MNVGYVLDLGKSQQVKRLELVTKTPGFTIARATARAAASRPRRPTTRPGSCSARPARSTRSRHRRGAPAVAPAKDDKAGDTRLRLDLAADDEIFRHVAAVVSPRRRPRGRRSASARSGCFSNPRGLAAATDHAPAREESGSAMSTATMKTSEGDDHARALRRGRAEDRRRTSRKLARRRLLRRPQVPPRHPGLRRPRRLPARHRHRRPWLHHQVRSDRQPPPAPARGAVDGTRGSQHRRVAVLHRA